MKTFFTKYGINKNGLLSVDKKKCLCGELVAPGVNECPNCGNSLKNKDLLNVDKNTSLAKLIQSNFEDNIFTYKILNLMSKGFELYEVEMFSFKIDNNTTLVEISDSKYFKTHGKHEEFIIALEKAMPKFFSFVETSLRQQEYDFATTNFSSLGADKISNFVYIYNNYKAMIPYIRGYKILNFGKNFNLKDFYPSIDFNDEKSIEKLDIYLPVLLTYDLKNSKYLESIVDIYKTRSKEELVIFNDCIDKFLGVTEDRNSRFGYADLLMNHRIYFRGTEITYNDINDSFSILYNKEISFEDFIRIYQNSREDFFCKILEVKKMLKKFNKKFSWSDVDKIDRKTYGTLFTKTFLKESKYSNEKIEDFYKELETNPIEALKNLTKE